MSKESEADVVYDTNRITDMIRLVSYSTKFISNGMALILKLHNKYDIEYLASFCDGYYDEYDAREYIIVQLERLYYKIQKKSIKI